METAYKQNAFVLRMYIPFQPFFLYFLNLSNSTNVNKIYSGKMLELRYQKAMPLIQLQQKYCLM